MKTTYNSPLSMKERDDLVRRFQAGGIGVFPTDTVYGLGCRADDVARTAEIFRLKERSQDKTLPLLIGSWDQFEKLCEKIRPGHRKKLEKVWPGGLTVVVPASAYARSLSFHCVREGTVAVRMPAHPDLRYVIERIGAPLAATSANRSGGVEAFSLAMVSQRIREGAGVQWGELISQGNLKPSTVVDLTGSRAKVLREGGTRF